MIEAIKQINGYQSMTNQQIADTLKASGVTLQPINRASLMDLLNKLGVLRKITRLNQSAKWQGSGLSMQAAIEASGNQAFVNAFDEWFSHITNPTNVSWDTTKATWSAAFWMMAQTFGDSPTMPSTDDFLAIAELGGGWVFADVTALQVGAALATDVTRQASDTLASEWTSLQNDGGINAAIASGDRAALVTALDAASAAIGGQ